MSRSSDARFALALVAGRVDLSDPGIAARLALIKSRYVGDDRLRRLIVRAADMHVAHLDRAPRTADAAYLRAVASGAVDCLASDVFARLEPIHERHKGDAEMMALFESAATAYADAALDAAADVLVGDTAIKAIEQARRRARNG